MQRCVVVFLTVLLSACAREAQVTELEKRISAMEGEAKTLRNEINDLKAEASFRESLQDWEGIAYMTPGADGYSLIKTDLGPLTVMLVNIQPYASGSKVTLRFGNLTSATIDGLKGKVEWGSVDKKGVPKNSEAKSRDIALNEALLSGSWTNATIVLEGVPPAELGFVRLRGVGHRGVRLRGPLGN